MDQEIIIDSITQISMTCHLWEIEGDVYGQTVTVYQSDGSTVVEAQTTPLSGSASLTFSGLTPNTTYIVKWSIAEPVTFTTLADEPKTATESQWQDLVNRVKAKSDVQITMTTTDPGEGSALAENHYVAVYDGDPIILDYSTSEVNTGAKWINGDAIYKKTLYFSQLANASGSSVSQSLTGVAQVVKFEAFSMDSSGSAWALPYRSAGGYGAFISYDGAQHLVLVQSLADMSAYSAYVTLYYTKSS